MLTKEANIFKFFSYSEQEKNESEKYAIDNEN